MNQKTDPALMLFSLSYRAKLINDRQKLATRNDGYDEEV